MWCLLIRSNTNNYLEHYSVVSQIRQDKVLDALPNLE